MKEIIESIEVGKKQIISRIEKLNQLMAEKEKEVKVFENEKKERQRKLEDCEKALKLLNEG